NVLALQVSMDDATSMHVGHCVADTDKSVEQGNKFESSGLACSAVAVIFLDRSGQGMTLQEPHGVKRLLFPRRRTVTCRRVRATTFDLRATSFDLRASTFDLRA